jgi:ABC-type multidrug transport system fused ATPase/permease subunit
VTPAAESERIGTRETLVVLGRALRYVAPFKARFAGKVVLTLLSLAPFLILPWPAKILIDHVIEGNPLGDALSSYPFFLRPFLGALVGMPSGELLAWTLAGVAVLVVLAGAMGTSGRERDQTDGYLQSGHDSATRTENQANAGWSFSGGLLGLVDFRWTIRLTQAFNHHYRSHLFERIQSLPMTAFDDERIGDAVFRVMYDTPAITETCYRVLLTPLVTPLAIVVTAFVLGHVFGEHPELFWIALSFFPGTLIVTFPFSGLIRRAGERSRRAGAVTTSTVEEGVSNIVAVQSLGGEGRERKRFIRDSWTSFGRYRVLLLVGMLTAIAALIPALFLIRYTLLYVADLAISGAISKGDFLVLSGYFFQILWYSVALGSVWISIQESAAGLRRVFFLMDLPAESDPPDARALETVRQGIRIEDAHVRYPDGTEALRGLDLEARIGQITAIVGPAGAGKTTLAYLIPRFLSPERGRVLVDEVDVARVTRESLRAQVAFVFQENVLFDGTIEENIRVGNLRASPIDVRRAAQIAGADEFIRALPDGYQTRLGRAGAKLSVGQKQRLTIARALVREAPILILDEPTSALDPETERRLVAALREASRTRVVLVIAHRLSTVRAADQTLFLDRGRILERGTHDELMLRPNGAYRRFVQLQTRGAA